LLELSVDDSRVVAQFMEQDGQPPREGALYERLISAGCLVPVDEDEVRALRLEREAARRDPGSLSLTVAPTMQCNFRCTYCFEEHRAEHMSDEVAVALVDLVRLRAGSAKSISVSWFGGEPLLSLGVIERVQRGFDEIAAARSIPSNKSLITNGYLLRGDVISRLRAMGTWDYIQVTLDGAPLIHDGRRILVSGAATWRRVVENVRNCLDGGLPVVIRMNIDTGNVDGIKEAIGLLADEGVLPRASVYLGSIISSTPECSHKAADVMARKQFATAQLSLQRHLLALGFPSGVSLPAPTCVLCTADKEAGLVVAPTGRLFKCWNEIHLDDAHAVGHLLQPQTDLQRGNLAAWERYDPFEKAGCRECHALPVCMGGCPWEARRSQDDRGECGQYRFFPKQVVQMAHAELAVEAGCEAGTRETE
jgi:uncharacterized protein